jgi:hypothetical protein
MAGTCLFLAVAAVSISFQGLCPHRTHCCPTNTETACSKPVVGNSVQIEPDWNLAAQAAPDYEVDQRINW